MAALARFACSGAVLVVAALVGQGCVESQVVLHAVPDASVADAVAASDDARADDAPEESSCAATGSCGVDAAKEAAATDAPLNACGGIAGLTCGADEWCHIDGCGDNDQMGTCEKRPDMCNAVAPCLSKVCGCNNVTYCDSCLANAAGVDVRHTGPC